MWAKTFHSAMQISQNSNGNFWSNGYPSIGHLGMESDPKCSKRQRRTSDRIVGKEVDINWPETRKIVLE